MKFKFTNHAQYRIDERGISIEDIKSVINAPDYARNTFDGRTEAGKKFFKKTLEVVYKKDGSATIIITVYYL